jgi:hypothetical protein
MGLEDSRSAGELSASRAILAEAALPKLPSYHINLSEPKGDSSESAMELARHIREGFARRYT